jgi:PAS domain S-box-containing protein
MQFSRADSKRLQMAKLGAVPAVILAFLVGLTIALNFALDWSRNSVFNSPNLVLILNVIFLTGTGLVVTYISAKSYSSHGSLNILFLGTAVLIGALSAAIAGLAAYSSPNDNNAIYNTGIMVSAALQFVSALATVIGVEFKGTYNRKTILTTAYALGAIFVVLLTVLVFADVAPAFLTASGVPTLARQVTLVSSVVFFTLGFILFGWHYFKTRSKVIFFYSIALGLFALGLVSAFAVHHSGELLTWLARTTLYVGSFYFIAAVLTSRTEAESTKVSDAWANAFRSDRGQIANLFSSMLDAFVYGKVILDENGKPVDGLVLEVNDAFEKITGIKREDAVGKKVTDMIPGVQDDPAGWIATYGHVAITGEPVHFENYLEPLKRWYHVSSYSPKKGYYVALFEDITERKKSEEAVKRSEIRFRALYENSFDAVLLTIPNGNVLSANPSACRLFGMTEKEIRDIGRDGIVVIDERAKSAMLEREKTGKAKAELTFKCKDGSTFEGEATSSLFTDADGTVKSSMIIRDITERKKAEAKLEEYSKNLERIVEERTRQLKDSERLAAIGATAGMVGHDIRNPLQAITGDIFLAKADLSEGPESEGKKRALESIEEIEKNVDYINKIVQDLQDYARPLNPKAEESDLKSILEKLIAKNRTPKNVKVKVDVSEEARKIATDSYYLNRILYNLITNSIQAMPNGGKLTIQAYREVNDTVITVKDTGVGIPEDIQGKMFTPMFTTKS